MAEYVLSDDDDQEQVVQSLLAEADDPGDVMWSPRPNVPFGGVYVIPDALAEKVAARKAAGQPSLAPAEEAEGVPADDEETPEESAEDAADAAVVDDPNTPEDEHEDAQNRVAARRAARKAAASSVTEKSE